MSAPTLYLHIQKSCERYHGTQSYRYVKYEPIMIKGRMVPLPEDNYRHVRLNDVEIARLQTLSQGENKPHEALNVWREGLVAITLAYRTDPSPHIYVIDPIPQP